MISSPKSIININERSSIRPETARLSSRFNTSRTKLNTQSTIVPRLATDEVLNPAQEILSPKEKRCREVVDEIDSWERTTLKESESRIRPKRVLQSAKYKLTENYKEIIV